MPPNPKAIVGALQRALPAAGRKLTPAEVAHQIAQRNAALPVEQGGLGLHAENTAMDRARALGYDLPAYHGTVRTDIEAFDPDLGKNVREKTGVWLSEHPEIANTYAGNPGGNVIPVLVRSNGLAEVDAGKANWSQIPQDTVIRHANGTDSLPSDYIDFAHQDYADTNELARISRQSGDKGLRVYNVNDQGGRSRWAGEVPEYADNLTVFDPRLIRSRFAAFDPLQRESADLLKAEGGFIDSNDPAVTAMKDGVQDPEAAAVLNLDLARLALINQPLQQMAGGGGVSVEDLDRERSPLSVYNTDQRRGADYGQIASGLGAALANQAREEYESLAQPRAVTDLINRGFIANTLGAPVDILNMGLEGVSWAGKKLGLGELPVSEKPVGGSDWLRERMVDAGVASDTERPLMETAVSFVPPNAPAGVARAGVKAAKAAAPFARDAAEMAAEMYMQGRTPLVSPASYVVKPKGGNWLPDSVERNLAVLKRYEEIEPLQTPIRSAGQIMTHINQSDGTLMTAENAAQYAPQQAVDKWIDKRLTPYVKNEMATPDDPVRALAEKGVLHFEPGEQGLYGTYEANALANRKASGAPERMMGQSDLAQKWETLSDAQISGHTAADWKTSAPPNVLAKMPWIDKLPPETRVYERNSPAMPENLGFKHLTDELRNALDPASGLPPNLLIEPKKLERMTTPDVVQHVAKINEWRAANAGKVNAELMAQFPVHKEYPDTGYKWIELTQPKAKSLDDLTPSQRDWYEEYLQGGVSPEKALQEAFKRENKTLEKALKNEGETMQHCVGSYCEEVASGKSRIYSLRDAKGEPHVTIEVQKNEYTPRWDAVKPYLPQAEELLRSKGITNANEEEISQLATQLAKENAPPRIVQIKGKQNRVPKEDYLPYVQDFVRSGQWSDVGDFHNTGLIDTQVQYPPETLAKIKAAGITPTRYITNAEHADIKSKVWPGQYAKGGSVKSASCAPCRKVHFTDDVDSMRLAILKD